MHVVVFKSYKCLHDGWHSMPIPTGKRLGGLIAAANGVQPHPSFLLILLLLRAARAGEGQTGFSWAQIQCLCCHVNRLKLLGWFLGCLHHTTCNWFLLPFLPCHCRCDEIACFLQELLLLVFFQLHSFIQNPQQVSVHPHLLLL